MLKDLLLLVYMEKPIPNTQTVEPEDGFLPAPVTVVKEPIKTLFAWQALSRPHKQYSREVYTTAASIIFLLCVILIFLKEFMLIVAILAFGFLFYALSSVVPEEIEYKITNRGLAIMDKKYPWEQLGRYWIEKKWAHQVLYIENYLGLPLRLMLVINPEDKDKIIQLLDRYLLKERPEKTYMEKAGDWLQQKVSLEANHRNTAPTPNSTPKNQ